MDTDNAPDLKDYPRPAVLAEQQREAMALAVKHTHGLGIGDIRKAIAVLVLENMRLANECNEHRRARGYKPIVTTNQ